MNVPPVWYLAFLAVPLAALVAHWLASRAERLPDLEPGETELEFGTREVYSFRLSYEYVGEFLGELRKKFENGWSTSQVESLVNKIVDRKTATWRASYVVTAAGFSEGILLEFQRVDRNVVLCRVTVPRAFGRIVGRSLVQFPAKMVRGEAGVGQ